MHAHVIRVSSEGDTANAGAPGSPRLNLDHNFAAQFLCCCDSFVSRCGHAAAWNLKSVRSKNGFALILVKSGHVWMLFRMKTPNVQRPTSNIQLGRDEWSVQRWALSVRRLF